MSNYLPVAPASIATVPRPGFFERMRIQKDQANRATERNRLKAQLARAEEAAGYARLAHGETMVDGVVLKRREVAYAAVAGAAFFQPMLLPGHWAGGSSGVSLRIAKGVSYRVGRSRGSFTPGGEELKITDTGSFVVTNRRCLFVGSKRTTEWAFAKLVGFNLEGAGVAVFNVTNRQKPSGVAYGEAAENKVDAVVTAAIAQFTGADAHRAVVDELDGDVAAIRAELAGVDHAPLPPGDGSAGGPAGPGWWGRKSRGVKAALVAGAIVVTLVVIGTVSGGSSTEPPKRDETPVASTSTTVRVTTTIPPTTVAPTTTAAPTTTVAPTTTAAPPVTAAPQPPPPPATTAPADVYYANCDAVRAAGAAPLHRGEPGYRAGLDRDDDGVACE
jgi:hypothetical protein